MRHIRVLICQVDDGTPDLMSELACFDLAAPDVATLQPETALDALEAVTQETGHAILRRLLHAQWDQIDAALVARHCPGSSGGGPPGRAGGGHGGQPLWPPAPEPAGLC